MKSTTLSRFGALVLASSVALGTSFFSSSASAEPLEGVSAKRVEKLSNLSLLSSDVTGVFQFQNGAKLWSEINESKLGSFLLELMEENDVDLASPEGPGLYFAMLFGEEFSLAVGKGTEKQGQNLMDIARLISVYSNASTMSQALGLEDGVFDFGEIFLEGFTENEAELANILGTSQMPPILLSFKVSDKDQRDQLFGAVEMGKGMAMMSEMPFLKAAEKQVGGLNFTGLEVQGEGLIELARSQGAADQLGGIFDATTVEDILGALSEKNLYVMAAKSEDAIHLFLGSSPDEIPVASDPSSSFVTLAELDFADKYLDEELLTFTWMSKGLMTLLNENSEVLGSYFEASKVVIDKYEVLGDTTKLEGLLDQCIELEKSYFSGAKSYPYGILSYLKADGLYIEGFGGTNGYGYDLTTPLVMGAPESEAFVTIHGAGDPEAVKKFGAYASKVGETAWEIVSLVGPNEELDMDGDFREFVEFCNGPVKGDLEKMLGGLKTAAKGVGNEFYFEIDVAGTWPTVPNIPAPFIEEAPFVRINFMQPVTERAKLAESWKAIEDSAANVLKAISAEMGEDIPMQRPMSSESNGNKTYFFAIPMQTDDCVPSVTLGDEFAVIGTSKNRALELLAAAGSKPEDKKGLFANVDLSQLHKTLKNYYDITAADPKAVFGDSESDLEGFEESKEYIEGVIEGLSEFDSFTMHTRLEDGEFRHSAHLKTK